MRLALLLPLLAVASALHLAQSITLDHNGPEEAKRAMSFSSGWSKRGEKRAMSFSSGWAKRSDRPEKRAMSFSSGWAKRSPLLPSAAKKAMSFSSGWAKRAMSFSPTWAKRAMSFSSGWAKRSPPTAKPNRRITVEEVVGQPITVEEVVGQPITVEEVVAALRTSDAQTRRQLEDIPLEHIVTYLNRAMLAGGQ